ncbi:MAG: hypothetical protein ACREBU_21205, partial [Nitrososphaera sp.]
SIDSVGVITMNQQFHNYAIPSTQRPDYFGQHLVVEVGDWTGNYVPDRWHIQRRTGGGHWDFPIMDVDPDGINILAIDPNFSDEMDGYFAQTCNPGVCDGPNPPGCVWHWKRTNGGLFGSSLPRWTGWSDGGGDGFLLVFGDLPTNPMSPQGQIAFYKVSGLNYHGHSIATHATTADGGTTQATVYLVPINGNLTAAQTRADAFLGFPHLSQVQPSSRGIYRFKKVVKDLDYYYYGTSQDDPTVPSGFALDGDQPKFFVLNAINSLSKRVSLMQKIPTPAPPDAFLLREFFDEKATTTDAHVNFLGFMGESVSPTFPRPLYWLTHSEHRHFYTASELEKDDYVMNRGWALGGTIAYVRGTIA